VLLRLPISTTGKLLKYKNVERMLAVLGEHRSTTASSLAEASSVSVKTAWSMLNDLLQTEHVLKKGRVFQATEKIGTDYISINLRDSLADRLFKHNATRALLYTLVSRKAQSLSAASKFLAVSRRTLTDIMLNLRECGIVSGMEVKSALVEEVDAVALIPREAHRNAVRHLLRFMADRYGDFKEPIVLFGDASWGRRVVTLNIAGMSRLGDPPEKHLAFAKSLASAAGNTTYHFGTLIDLLLTTEDALLSQKLGLVTNPHPLLDEISDGLCVHGRLPEKDDYFELMNHALSFSEQRVQELLDKGYLERRENGRYVCTEKAFNAYRREAMSGLEERTIQIEGKAVRFIAITPPPTRRSA
jgi:hypothetical protein